MRIHFSALLVGATALVVSGCASERVYQKEIHEERETVIQRGIVDPGDPTPAVTNKMHRSESTGTERQERVLSRDTVVK